MKIHRAVTLVVMMALALLAVDALARFDGRSLIALAVVLVGVAAGDIGFSWKRYYKC